MTPEEEKRYAAFKQRMEKGKEQIEKWHIEKNGGSLNIGYHGRWGWPTLADHDFLKSVGIRWTPCA